MGSNNSVPAKYNAATYAVLSVDIVLTTAAVTGRIASRKQTRATPTIDDYLCYFAFVANLGLLASGIFFTTTGALNLDIFFGQSDEQWYLQCAAYKSLVFLYVLTITSIKLSVLFYYRRTFDVLETCFRWCWWILLNVVLLWTATCIILLALHIAGRMPANGFPRVGMSTTGMINTLSDILLLILSAVIITRMKLPMDQKVVLGTILGIGGIASISSLIRNTLFLVQRDRPLNEAYSNYLDVILIITESSAGLICACLPFANPILMRFTAWLRRVCGIGTTHHGWATMSAPTENTEKEKDRTITRVVDYHVQLLPVSKISNSQATLQDRDAMILEKPWQSIGPYEVKAHCESNARRAPARPISAMWKV